MSNRAEINVFTTRELYNRNGRVSEKMAAEYIANALWDAGFEANVQHGFDIQDIPETSKMNVFNEWLNRLNNGEVPVAKDDNVILTDDDGGGLSFVSGIISVAPGRNIDEEKDWHRKGTGDWFRNMHAVLHEVGHALGAKHDHDPDTDGRNHPSMGWNEGWWFWGRWHRHPTVAANGVFNACGEWVEERRYSTEVEHMTFHECFVDNYLTLADG